MSDSVIVYDAGKLPGREVALALAMRRALTVAGMRVALKLTEKQESLRPTTIATGHTIRSHTVSPVMQGSSSGGAIMYVVVGPRTPYAKWGIETGRRPGGAPPFGAILAWVREKPFGAGLSEQEAFRTAKAIQHHIAVAGTKAYHVMSSVEREERAAVLHTIRLAAASALRGG